jgi:polyhydroxybutyrate depolymerase
LQTWIKWLIGIPLILLGLVVIVGMVGAVAYRLSDRTNGSIISSGEKRSYLLYVPESYDPAKPTSLVISIHGFVQWPANQMQLTRWNDLADQYGFIVVYPSGTGFPKRWRAGISGSNPDVAFISDLIDKLESDYNIDPTRIYANGMSNGGGMTFLLSCSLSDRIAAIGTVAGAYSLPWNECHPSRPVPAIVFHGTADPIVPYQGGLSGDSRFNLPAISGWVEELAGRNGCKAPPVEIPNSGEVSGVQYGNCDKNTDVVFYTIAGGGHTWPGGKPLPKLITGRTTMDTNATKKMWDFFQQHPMPGE